MEVLPNTYLVIYGQNLELRGTQLDDIPKINLKDDPNYEFKPNYRYLILNNDINNELGLDKTPYQIISSKIHLGPRREGHWDISKMDYLLTREGYIFKFIYPRYEQQTQWITKEQYDGMLPHIDEISKRLKHAKLREIWSERKQKHYHIFNYDVLADPSDDIVKFLCTENYIHEAPKVSYYKIIREKEDLINSFKYFILQPVGSRFGFDYETRGGFPFDSPKFKPMGLGIADNLGCCAYFDIEYIENYTDYYDLFIELLVEFLDKHECEVYTYNVGFELRVTYLLTKKMYKLQDSAAINKLQGDVAYNLSLKYTAMRYCYVASWDNDFEIMQEYLAAVMNNPDEMFDRDMYDQNLPTYYKDTYKSSPDWIAINQLFPGEQSEFERLIDKYWGDPFGCIPSNILGKYCCQDAYYTLLIRNKSDELGFTDDAWNCFSSNLRLGAHLNINGCFIDVPYQKYMHDSGHVLSSFGALNMALLWISMQLNNSIGIPDVPYVNNAISDGINPFDSKSALESMYDESWENNLNYDKLISYYSLDLAKKISQRLNDWDCLPMEYGIFRKRSLFNDINQLISEHWNIKYSDNKIKLAIDGSEYILDNNLDSIIYYSRLLRQKKEIEFLLTQFKIGDWVETINDINGNPVRVDTLKEYATSIFNPNSPPDIKVFFTDYFYSMKDVIYTAWEPDKVIKYLYEDSVPEMTYQDYRKYRNSSSWLFIIRNYDSYMNVYGKSLIDYCKFYIKKKLPVDLNNYENITLDSLRKLSDEIFKTIKDSDEYSESEKDEIRSCCRYLLIKKIYKDNPNRLFEISEMASLVDWIWKCHHFNPHEDEDFKLSKRQEFYRNALSNAFTRLEGFFEQGNEMSWTASGLVWESVAEDEELAERFYNELPNYDITQHNLRGLAKMAFCYRAMRKYDKVLSTYVDGMLIDTARYCKEYDENAVGTARWEGSGPVYKAFPRYDVCQKKSKRWASNFHTIPSKSECKRIVTAPKSFLMSYFDISGMEVRTLSYLAKDDFMINNYAKGVDPYIDLGKLAFPGHDDAFYKALRSDMKTSLLGSLYGMGSETLGGRIGKSSQEAEELLTIMFTHMDDIKVLIEHKAAYPEEHDGYVETILGDKLNISDEPKDRWGRLGNNLCIQGGSAVLMADAFENIIQHSFSDKEIIVRPVNVVHDSSQNYFETSKIFDINPFYNRHLRKYLYDKYGIDYAFDTLVGPNYFDMAEVKVIDKDTVLLEGNYKSVNGIINKLNEDNVTYKILSLKSKKDVECFVDGKITEDFKPKMVDNFIKQFYLNGMGAIWELDFSKFKLTITRAV